MLPRPEHPRPQLRRRDWVNLNGEWEFAPDERARFERKIQVPFCPQSALSGIGEQPADVVWYRRTFEAPDAERLRLHFGAVDYRATAWVNGDEVANHEGGHTPFAADVKAALGPGPNELVVRAEDPLADQTLPRGKQHWTENGEGIFYTPTTGIWQTVWLEPLPERHLESLRLQPDLATGSLGFEVEAPGTVEVVARLGGEVAGRYTGPAGEGRMRVDPVRSWRPGAPHLYDLELRLLDRGGRELDRAWSYFGLRTVETGDGRFWLNGEPFLQRLILDQGYFPGGLLTAPADRDLKRDVELALALGFNGARKHQKIEDPRWLYWADVLGLLVWAEMPCFHLWSEAAERRLAGEWTAAVERDRDHPCVVTWVPANESFGIDTLDDASKARFLDHLYRLTHELDGSRPVVSNDGWEHATTDLLTVHDYSSPTQLSRRCRNLEALLQPRSGRRPFLPGYGPRDQPVLVSEFGGLSFMGSGGWGYGQVAGPDELLREYAALVSALMAPGPVEGFCYTQMTDVEQERNGLLTFDRRPKAGPAHVRRLTAAPKQR